MCTGLEIAALGSMALSVGGAIAQNTQIRRAARQTYAMERENTLLTYNANQVAEQQTNIAANQQARDRARRAVAELGALRVAAGEMGASARSAALLAGAAGYAEGTDRGRIEQNRRAQIAQIQADSRAARRSYLSNTTIARTQTESMLLGNILDATGNVLQIGSDTYLQRRRERLAQNRQD